MNDVEEGEAWLQRKILVKLDPQALSLANKINFLHNTIRHSPVDELGVKDRGLCSEIQPTALDVLA